MRSRQERMLGDAAPGVPEREVAGAPKGADPESSGWERRFEADAARIAELTELYSDLGYQVMTVGLDPKAFGPECTTCALTACLRYRTLYTRRGGLAGTAQAGAALPGRPGGAQ